MICIAVIWPGEPIFWYFTTGNRDMGQGFQPALHSVDRLDACPASFQAAPQGNTRR